MGITHITMTPATPQYYITLAELKSYMNITKAAQDDLLTETIARAQQYIVDYTKRRFIGYSDTRYYDQSAICGNRLMLDEELLTITSITNGDGSDTVIDPTGYFPYPRNLLPISELRAKTNVIWQAMPDYEITVTGVWGYSMTPPATIAMACLRMASWLYRMSSQQNTDNDKPIVLGDGTIIMPASIPKDIMGMLDQYKRRAY